jgi:hypothetical protein
MKLDADESSQLGTQNKAGAVSVRNASKTLVQGTNDLACNSSDKLA